MDATVGGDGLALASTRGRWVLAATATGSGIAFLDSTVVTVALPHIGEDLDTGVAGLQWVLNGYLVALSALILLGGSLGDRFGCRRAFDAGVVIFTVASVICALAPTVAVLVAARVLQGARLPCSRLAASPSLRQASGATTAPGRSGRGPA